MSTNGKFRPKKYVYWNGLRSFVSFHSLLVDVCNLPFRNHIQLYVALFLKTGINQTKSVDINTFVRQIDVKKVLFCMCLQFWLFFNTAEYCCCNCITYEADRSREATQWAMYGIEWVRIMWNLDNRHHILHIFIFKIVINPTLL